MSCSPGVAVNGALMLLHEYSQIGENGIYEGMWEALQLRES
jgi:hypothetical protein